MRSAVITILLFLCSYCNAATLDSLWTIYTDPGNKTDKTLIFEKTIQYCREHSQPDSILDRLTDAARLSGDNNLLVQSLALYFEPNHELDNIKEAKSRAANMLSLAEDHNNDEWYYLAYSALARIAMEEGEASVAQDHMEKAYYHASLLENEALRGKCMLQFGNCQEQNNLKIDAFRNYMNALLIAERTGDEQLVFDTYTHLSAFYLLLGDYSQAKDYKWKQVEMVMKQDRADSLKLMKLRSDLAIILFANDEKEEAETISTSILRYAYRIKDQELIEMALDPYRSYLIEHNLLPELTGLYTKKYPDQLDHLQQTNKIFYYRVMAYISEAGGNMKEALDYYELTEKELPSSPYANENIYISNFHKRYAQFLLRQGDIVAATRKMERAHEEAKNVDYLPYLIETSQYLDSLNHLQGNIANAYMYSKLNKGYVLRQNDINREDELLVVKIDNEEKQAAFQQQREEQQRLRRHNLQYMGMLPLIAFCFIFLAALGVFKMPVWFIKAVSFISFIFLFEFIILLADNKIHHITHGEPWKVMAIKIVLISILLPLHHWLEHKAIKYLTSKRIIFQAGMLKRIIAKPKPKKPATRKPSGPNGHQHETH